MKHIRSEAVYISALVTITLAVAVLIMGIAIMQ
jgi:hypothetical protein